MAEVNSDHVRTSSGASILSYDYDSSKGILTITFNIYIGDGIKSCSAGYTIEALLIQ